MNPVQAGFIVCRSMAVYPVRKFPDTGMELGVGYDRTAWFVFDRKYRERQDWHKHCGPYSTRAQAEGWINDIRAVTGGTLDAEGR